jgi:DNA-binding NtrC family response regulator
VRELENVMERACVTCRERMIPAESLSELSHPHQAHSPFRVDVNRPLPDLLKEMTAEIERRYIRKALRKTRGNVGRCTKICGLSRRSISAKIAEYQIDKAETKES